MTEDLRSHLWECAEIHRGSAVDRTDWKADILPLLFFKRISDVWDEETADAATLFGDTEPVDFPEVHLRRVAIFLRVRTDRRIIVAAGSRLDVGLPKLEAATRQAFRPRGVRIDDGGRRPLGLPPRGRCWAA